MVDAILNYYSPCDEKPFAYLVEPPEGTPWRNWETTPIRMTIEDGREWTEEPTLDTAGLALVRHQTQVADLYASPTVREHYYPEMEQLVKRVTGAVRVHAFDHNIRSASDANRSDFVDDTQYQARAAQGSDDPGQKNLQTPVYFAHNDYTPDSGPQRLREILPDEAETLLKRRFAIINVWKPIRGPVQDTPLAVLDARSLGDTDLTVADLIYRDRVGEIAYLEPNPKHRWVYYSQMQADEALLLKCYDSDPEELPFTAHTAFEDPSCPEGALPRESIEVRTFAFF